MPCTYMPVCLYADVLVNESMSDLCVSVCVCICSLLVLLSFFCIQLFDREIVQFVVCVKQTALQ